MEFDDFYHINVYVVNSGGKELLSLSERIIFDSYLRAYVNKLKESKPVVICGDFNVAHGPLDLKNAKSNSNRAGFTDEERESFSKLLNSGFIDTFRYKNKDTIAYSWFTQLSKFAKRNNSGWRIDYFLVSDDIKDKIERAIMLDSGERKDHLPILLELNL